MWYIDIISIKTFPGAFSYWHHVISKQTNHVLQEKHKHNLQYWSHCFWFEHRGESKHVSWLWALRQYNQITEIWKKNTILWCKFILIYSLSIENFFPFYIFHIFTAFYFSKIWHFLRRLLTGLKALGWEVSSQLTQCMEMSIALPLTTHHTVNDKEFMHWFSSSLIWHDMLVLEVSDL